MKAFTAILVLSAALLALAAVNPDHYDLSLSPKALFHAYVRDMNVSFASPREHAERLAVFSANLDKIKELNAQAQAAGKNTRFGVNKFTLYSPEEFRNMMLNKAMPSSWIPDETSTFAPIAPQQEIDGLPTSWDWRTIKPAVVTPVKNQGQCGSCYTFSTTGNIEGVWALAGHPLVALSEQQLVDCDQTCINGVCDGGCNGGLMENAMTWVIKNGGLESEADYPYEGINDQCKNDKTKTVASIDSYTFVNKTSVQMQAFLYKNGPISIAADASLWQYYITGVWYFPCGTTLDHGILIVGWGVEKDVFGQQMPYWIVKNSWGEDWGMSGYILIERGDDRCGLQKYPISALINKNATA